MTMFLKKTPLALLPLVKGLLTASGAASDDLTAEHQAQNLVRRN